MATAHVPTREDVLNTFTELSAVLHAALRPLPTQTGDHTYLDADKPNESLLKQLKALNIENAGTVKDVIAHLGGRPTDDRTYIMERVVRLASQLPLASYAGKGVTNSFLTQLWNDLKHPPLSYLGEDFMYRKADGSNNNILWPHIGAAGAPYARSHRSCSRLLFLIPALSLTASWHERTSRNILTKSPTFYFTWRPSSYTISFERTATTSTYPIHLPI